jgi:transcriptional regulator with XRE-family HTH domain
VAKRDSCNYTLQGKVSFLNFRLMDAFNREFVRLMAESGWTSKVCMERLGLSKGAISQYRNGITRPSLQVLRLFSALSGYPLQIPGESPPQARELRPLTEQEDLMLELIRQFGPNQRSAIAALLAAMTPNSESHPAVEVTPSTDAAVIQAAGAVVADAARHIAVSAAGSGPPAKKDGPPRRVAARR